MLARESALIAWGVQMTKSWALRWGQRDLPTSRPAVCSVAIGVLWKSDLSSGKIHRACLYSISLQVDVDGSGKRLIDALMVADD